MINYEDVTDCILRTDEDGKTWAIPKISENSDYQAYLKHLTEKVADSTEEQWYDLFYGCYTPRTD